jgi:cytochrome c oxidase subunit 3
MKKILSLFFNIQQHSYHMVTFSPWPLIGSLAAFVLTTGGAMYMHFFKSGFFVLEFGLFLVLMVMVFWWRDVIRESTFEGTHTKLVQRGLKIGVILFILSEVMFFFAFFWAFFHSALAPSVELGSIWPPVGLIPFNPWEIPLLNTCILVLSGLTITYTHHYIINGDKHFRLFVMEGFTLTLFLALCFTGFQYLEYIDSPFSIWDGVYGSTFFLATGFHGFHVIIGTTFIFICFIRYLRGHFTSIHHIGFEAAAWYWHFVDVVWLFLYLILYCWGGYHV